jgi:spore coat protein U-like protein
MKRVLLLTTAAALSLCTGVVSAEPVNGSPGVTNFNVTATITSACNDITAGDIDFGSVPQGDDTVDVVGIISVICGNNVPYSITLTPANTPAGPGLYQLADGGSGEFLDYVIFQPNADGSPATTAQWGTGTDAFDGIGTGAQQDLSATGRLTVNSGVTPGTFSDLITVELTF